MKINKKRISVVTYPYWHYTFEYCLDSIAACGFENVEFWAASPQYCYTDYTQHEREVRKREIAEMLRTRGLSMPVFHPEQSNMYPLNIASPEAYIREHSMQYVREYIEDCAVFGAKTMILAPGRRDHDDPNPDHYKRAVESISLLADYAKQHQVLLAIEEWPAFMCAFADNLGQLQQLLSDVGKDNVRACLNTCAMHGNGETIGDYIRARCGRGFEGVGGFRLQRILVSGYPIPGLLRESRPCRVCLCGLAKKAWLFGAGVTASVIHKMGLAQSVAALM